MTLTEEIIKFGDHIGKEPKMDYYLYKGAIHQVIFESIYSDVPMMTMSYSEGTVCFDKLMEQFS